MFKKMLSNYGIGIFMAVIASLALYDQHKALSLTEKQFSTQLTDVKTALSRIQAQKGELFNEKLKRLSQSQKHYIGRAQMHGQLLDIGNLDRQNTARFISSLMLTQSALHDALLSQKLSPDIRNVLLSSRLANARLASIIGLYDDWHKKLEKLRKSNAKRFKEILDIRPVTKDIPDKLDIIIQDLARETALLNGAYSEKLKPISSNFKNAQKVLLKKLKAIKFEIRD